MSDLWKDGNRDPHDLVTQISMTNEFHAELKYGWSERNECHWIIIGSKVVSVLFLSVMSKVLFLD